MCYCHLTWQANFDYVWLLMFWHWCYYTIEFSQWIILCLFKKICHYSYRCIMCCNNYCNHFQLMYQLTFITFSVLLQVNLCNSFLHNLKCFIYYPLTFCCWWYLIILFSNNKYSFCLLLNTNGFVYFKIKIHLIW